MHDYLRGWPGLFDKLSAGIKYVREERDKRGLDFPIIIKPTIGKKNYKYLPEMVEWAKDMGATAPQLPAHGPMDQGNLRRALDRGGRASRAPEGRRYDARAQAEGRADHQLGAGDLADGPAFPGAKRPPEAMPCRVGMRDFFIRTNGDIEVCFFYPSIGNIKEASAREIWYGPKAREIRKQTVECDRLCLYTCLSQKTLGDKVKMGLTLLTAQEERETTGGQARGECPHGPPVSSRDAHHGTCARRGLPVRRIAPPSTPAFIGRTKPRDPKSQLAQRPGRS